jgi:hypothetical protein
MRQEKLPEAAFFVPVEKRCACSPDVVAATIGSLLNASAKWSMMLTPIIDCAGFIRSFGCAARRALLSPMTRWKSTAPCLPEAGVWR